MEQHDHTLDSFFDNMGGVGVGVDTGNLLMGLQNDHQYIQDVNASFEARQKLYNTAHTFHDQAQDNAVHDQQPDTELVELGKYVKLAREKLETELNTYSQCLDKVQGALEILHLVDSSRENLDHTFKYLTDQLSLKDPSFASREDLKESTKQYMAQRSDFFNDLKNKYQEQKETNIVTLNESAKKLKAMTSIYKDVRAATFGPICPVCMHREVETYLDPCGHTFCNSCVRSSHCYICRVRIKNKNKLYFT
jgi:hypothetical protein